MKKRGIVILVLLTLLLGGCGGSGKDGNGTSGAGAEDSGNKSAATGLQAIPDSADMFTDRDYEVGYDEGQSTVITLLENTAECSSGAVEVSGSTVTVIKSGTYILSGTLEGMVIVDAEKTDKIQLVLAGADIHSESSAAIYVRQADKVFLTLAPESENTVKNGGQFIAIDDNNIDAAIFSKEDLTLNGQGSLTIESPAGHGIVSKDDLAVTSGTYKVVSSSHGLSGKDSVRVAGGTFDLTVGKDGIHAENKDDTTLGFVYIMGGTLQIAADDDGLHADQQMFITGGQINITKSYEGIEGTIVDISGGEITVVSEDDGLNAAGGNDQSGISGFGGGGFKGGGPGTGGESGDSSSYYIRISGGRLNVNASGDGLDSNGALYVSGGEIYVSGPTNSGNGALDYDSEAAVTGGILAAAGASGMAQNFGSTSTQGSMLASTGTQTGGTAITLTDSSGKTLLSWTPEKAFECVVISCPDIIQGETYTVSAGEFSTEIVMSSLIYGNGGMDGGPGGMRGGPGGMRGDPGEMKGAPGERGDRKDFPGGTGGDFPNGL